VNVSQSSEPDVGLRKLKYATKCNFIFVNMPHSIHKCTNTLYDYAIINY